MKFDRSKEIEQYIKSLDECEAFDRVKVVSIERFDRFDRYKIASISVKNGSIITNEEFESKIKSSSKIADTIKTLLNEKDDLNRAPKEITTSITGTRK